MYKKSILRPLLLIGLIVVLFASCDKDFDQLGTDIVGNDHFGFTKYTGASIKSYNERLGPVASNNLPINPLGFYENPAFGTTQANFVTQLELASINPVFNNTNNTLYQTLPVIDSVVMQIPYFSKLNTTNTDGTKLYDLDSIYGVPESKFKLSVFQSNYYLRDLDPDLSLAQAQPFYTNQDTEIDSYKIPVLLNDLSTTDGHENSQFFFDKREHKTTVLNTDNTTTTTRSVPSMRLHLNSSVFYNKILNAPSGQLANNALFKNYFRGLYFKVENGSPGNMAMINFKGGTITIYYKEDLKTTNATVTPPVDTWSRVSKTFVLNLTGNTVSLLNNSNENTDYLSAINNTSEASKLYLKGGEGSLAYVDLFGSTDLYGYVVKKDANNNPIDENGNIIPLNSNGDPISGYLIYIKSIVPNGISDELDDLRYPNISSDPSSIYYSKKNRWLINEANLTFYIDNASMSNTQTAEPNRIFLYDMKNKKPLVDYLYDFTTNSVYPKFSKYIHGGILEKENVTNGRGIRYKIRITNHLRNLIKNDSTNVRLGISVTENINNIAFSKRKLPVTDAVLTAPSMSVMSPLGTILYGSNPSVSDDKRLKLEIYYTKPN